MSRITLKFVPVTPQTLLTTENLCFKQKSNFYEKVLPPTVMVCDLDLASPAVAAGSGSARPQS